MKLKYESFSRDLYADRIPCTCKDKRYDHGLINTRIQLSGYADDNFFDNVHKEAHNGACSGCGRKYTYQWFRSHVEFNWVK